AQQLEVESVLVAEHQEVVPAVLGDRVENAGRARLQRAPCLGGTVGREVPDLRLVEALVADQQEPVVHNLPAGAYNVEVRYLGYRAETREVTVGTEEEPAAANFRLVAIPLNLAAIEVTTAVPLAVDTRTGNQIFKQNDYHGAPTNTTSQILQQSIVGAARAPTGEVHIRGQHAEYTYYVDGLPVPAGISGSLNELFDPE